MKNILLVLVISLITISSYAQKKNAVYKFEVKGVCEMCKERIEKACLDTKGVKYAIWSVETNLLKVIINEKKTTIKRLKENIAIVGHDSDEVKATNQVYANMHECCKYRDTKVIKTNEKK